jgi:hypothetical protein
MLSETYRGFSVADLTTYCSTTRGAVTHVATLKFPSFLWKEFITAFARALHTPEARVNGS